MFPPVLHFDSEEGHFRSQHERDGFSTCENAFSAVYNAYEDDQEQDVSSAII